MAKYSLDQVRQTAAKDFTAMELEADGQTVALRNPLRLNDEENVRVKHLTDDISELEKQDEAEAKDIRPKLVELLVVVSDNRPLMQQFADSLDLAEILTVYKLWGEETGAAKSDGGN